MKDVSFMKKITLNNAISSNKEANCVTKCAKDFALKRYHGNSEPRLNAIYSNPLLLPKLLSTTTTRMKNSKICISSSSPPKTFDDRINSTDLLTLLSIDLWKHYDDFASFTVFKTFMSHTKSNHKYFSLFYLANFHLTIPTNMTEEHRSELNDFILETLYDSFTYIPSFNQRFSFSAFKFFVSFKAFISDDPSDFVLFAQMVVGKDCFDAQTFEQFFFYWYFLFWNLSFMVQMLTHILDIYRKNPKRFFKTSLYAESNFIDIQYRQKQLKLAYQTIQHSINPIKHFNCFSHLFTQSKEIEITAHNIAQLFSSPTPFYSP